MHVELPPGMRGRSGPLGTSALAVHPSVQVQHCRFAQFCVRAQLRYSTYTRRCTAGLSLLYLSHM